MKPQSNILGSAEEPESGLQEHVHYKWNCVGHNWGKKISSSNPNNPKFKNVIVL